jgi:DNA-binding NarL/FixJ family response regulator
MVYDHIHGSDYSRSPVDKLSDRELEILQLIGKGHDVRDIAQGLHLSPKTVEAHRAHIKEKLDLASAREVVRFATNWLMLQST